MKENCENGSFIPLPPCFRSIRHIYVHVGPTLWLASWTKGGDVQVGYLSTFLHYTSMLMLYLLVQNTFESDKTCLVQKGRLFGRPLSPLFNKCPIMHENECNLAGDTITFDEDISGVIHCIRFILLTFMMIKIKAFHRHKIISGGCYKTAHHQIPPRLM